MKWINIFFTILFCLSLFILNALAAGKVRIAVMDFQNNSEWYWWGEHLGRAAADELVTQLVKTGKFSVIERDKLQAVLDEQALGASGAVSSSTAAKIGKILGVQLILTGSITKFSIKRYGGRIKFVGASYSNAESTVDVRLIDTNTAEILLADEATGSKKFGSAWYKNIDFEKQFDQGVAQESLRPSIEKIVEKIVAQYDKLSSLAPVSGSGKIIDVKSPQKVYIDQGANSEIKEGDKFSVYRITDTIKDEEGNVLDTVKSKVGEIEVIQVLSKSAICKIVSGSAQKGDTFSKE